MIRDVPCWFEDMELYGGKRAKVKAYNRDKLIIPIGLGLFELLPLKGNSRTHTVFYGNIPENNSCTCQNFVIKNDKECSHIMAVAYYDKIKNGVIQQ